MEGKERPKLRYLSSKISESFLNTATDDVIISHECYSFISGSIKTEKEIKLLVYT